MMSSTRRKGIGSLTVWVETEIKAVCEWEKRILTVFEIKNPTYLVDT